MSNEIFKANPELDLCYQTSDGEAFFTPNAAENHAKSLKKKEVKTLYRSDYEDLDELDEDYEDSDELDESTDKLWNKLKGILVTGAEIVQPETVVTTDPFDPETFPNRVLTDTVPNEPEAPEQPETPAETEATEAGDQPQAPAEPEAPVVTEETKSGAAKNQKK